MKRETIDLFNRIFKVLEPPPDLTLSQWADRYRRLSSESGSKGGKWNTEKAPWQREIMDAITDISVEKVVVMSAAQMGKTDAFLLNTIGYYMHYDPCTILCMQPTLSLAETMSKDRLMPMVRDTPALRDKINEKSRTAGNTIFKKAFPGGRITMTGANSPTELRSRPIRILLADEIDAYPPTAGAEGDPLILAGKRLTTYWNLRRFGIRRRTAAYRTADNGQCGKLQSEDYRRCIKCAYRSGNRLRSSHTGKTGRGIHNRRRGKKW